jgi:hypothetical protein
MRWRLKGRRDKRDEVFLFFPVPACHSESEENETSRLVLSQEHPRA